MGFAEHQGLKGRLSIAVKDLNNNIIRQVEINNLITHAGRKLLADFISGQSEGWSNLVVAVGSDDEASDEMDTSLKNQVAEVTVPKEGFTTHHDKTGVGITLTATLPPADEGEEQLLQEAGIVVSLQDGSKVLYNRTVFPVITRTDNLKITLSWELTF